MTLKDAQVGSTVKVVKIHGEGAYKRRIMDMGITKEAHFHSKSSSAGRPPWARGYDSWI